MISCSQCAKAFVFAEIRESQVPLEELGRREAERRGLSSITQEEVTEWAEGMAEALAPFDVGDVIVYLDGEYFRVNDINVRFEGYFASHDLKQLPHAEALEQPGRLLECLGDSNYWLSRELPDRET